MYIITEHTAISYVLKTRVFDTYHAGFRPVFRPVFRLVSRHVFRHMFRHMFRHVSSLDVLLKSAWPLPLITEISLSNR